MAYPTLLAVLEILGMFVIGWAARHWGYLREKDLGRWTALAVDILTPALSFHVVITGLEAGQLGGLWAFPVVGFGIMALGALLGYLLRRPLQGRAPPETIRTFHHFCAVNNYGFLPLILVRNLWGTEAMAHLFILNLGSNIAYWSIGVALLGGHTGWRALKHLLTPALISLLLALALSLTGGAAFVPQLVLNISSTLGGAAIPCMLILVGAGLYPFPKPDRIPLQAWLAFVRLIALPLLTIAVILLLPLPVAVERLAVVVALMPAAASSVVLTRRFGGDPDFAAFATLQTTLLALITIPLGIALFIS